MPSYPGKKTRLKLVDSISELKEDQPLSIAARLAARNNNLVYRPVSR